ncbi:MAG: hypothetical protein U9O98_01030 [Asgard group archaeon]|nr:hypothetical protein [Asgard group archaeon]
MKEAKIQKFMHYFFVLFLISSILQIPSVKGTLTQEGYIGETLEWTIEDVTDQSVAWVNYTTFETTGHWQAQANSAINYTIVYRSGNGTNLDLHGQFKIGNFSINTSNSEIGFNLALSGYTWMGGLIATEDDWMKLQTQEPFINESGTIKYNQIKTFNNTQINTVQIKYNNSFQTSTLWYETRTGILIEANTRVGNFWINFSLSESTIALPRYTAPLSMPTPMLVGLSILVLSIGIPYKRKKVENSGI